MSRPQQHYDDPQYGQGGQTDSYYQDDYGPQGYSQQGEGYYEEQYVSVAHMTTWSNSDDIFRDYYNANPQGGTHGYHDNGYYNNNQG